MDWGYPNANAAMSEKQPAPDAGGGGDLSLTEFVRTIWRGRRIIAAVAIGLTLLAGLILWRIPPLYTGKSLILLEAGEQKLADMESVLQDSGRTDRTVPSEIEVLQSRALAGRVIDQLKLDQDPEFNPALRAPTLEALAAQVLPARWMPDWLRTDETASVDTEFDMAVRRDRVIDQVLERLDVIPKGVSWVVELTFASRDPAMSARIANAFATLYVDRQVETRVAAAKRATVWLDYMISKLRRDVQRSEHAVEDFRAKSGLLRGDNAGATLLSDQISALNVELIHARAQTAEVEARLDQIRRLLAAGGVASASEVLQSALIRELRLVEAQLARKYAELSTSLGPSHPMMRNIEAERRDLHGKISAEIQYIVGGLENERAVAKNREASIAEAVNGLKAQVADADKANVELRSLEREAEANRGLLENFLTRLKETTAQAEDNAQTASAEVLSPASVPARPSFPRFGPTLAATFFVATILGVIAVFIKDLLDAGFRSSSQIKALTGLPALALVPAVDIKKGDVLSHLLRHHDDAEPMFEEAMASLHTRLMRSTPGGMPRTLLMASSLPKEGKTTLAASLVVARALAGEKALIVETDLRRPAAHVFLNTPRGPGLGEVLQGSASLADTIVREARTGAHILAAGDVKGRPPDLLASAAMNDIVEQLRADYDLVVFDSPPILAVTDACLLARWTDALVFIVRWAKTPRQTALFGLEQFANVGCDVTGVVLSMVDPAKHSEYGYGDSAYYYDQVRSYYQRPKT
jgi:polysaccharide biosynthesis transport protein